MRLRLSQSEFQRATTILAGLVGRSSLPMPVLQNILIIAEKGVIRLEGTDIESQIVATIPGVIEREGRATVEGSRVASLAKLFPAGSDVVFDAGDGKATITCETNEYKLLTLPVEDFPEWTAEKWTTRFRIEARRLKELIAITEYALATGKDGRRVLHGIYMEVRENELRLTATDGKKLSRVVAPLPEVEGAATVAVIIPDKTVAEVRKALDDNGSVEVEITQRQIFFTAANITFRTQAIEGKYPDCDLVIPKEESFTGTVGIDRDRFLAQVRRAGIVASDMNRSIVLRFEGAACEFQAMAHDVGSFSGRVPVEYGKEPLRIAFNCEYLIETLAGFGSPEIRMFVKSGSAPVIFKSAKEPDRLSLLMPIKLTSVPSAGGEQPET